MVFFVGQLGVVNMAETSKTVYGPNYGDRGSSLSAMTRLTALCLSTNHRHPARSECEDAGSP
jgi:hypothetical protein